MAGVLDTVRRRSDDETGSIYLLVNPTGIRVAGNLDHHAGQRSSRTAAGLEFPFVVKKEDRSEWHRARAYYTALPGGAMLVVGRDVEELRQFGTIIRNTIIGATIITLDPRPERRPLYQPQLS